MFFEQFLNFLGKEFDFDTTGITPETTFEEINFDEFDVIELVMSAEDAYRVEIDDEALKKMQSIGDFAAFLEEATQL